MDPSGRAGESLVEGEVIPRLLRDDDDRKRAGAGAPGVDVGVKRGGAGGHGVPVSRVDGGWDEAIDVERRRAGAPGPVEEKVGHASGDGNGGEGCRTRGRSHRGWIQLPGEVGGGVVGVGALGDDEASATERQRAVAEEVSAAQAPDVVDRWGKIREPHEQKSQIQLTTLNERIRIQSLPTVDQQRILPPQNPRPVNHRALSRRVQCRRRAGKPGALLTKECLGVGVHESHPKRVKVVRVDLERGGSDRAVVAAVTAVELDHGRVAASPHHG
ncbi:hypothetical protein BDK51DRAFT_46778 [Blyttiomyces helicus]|uniref:Uncharacterized protein n=1 Tax=Blyttiomyces helicus TaxID=388810 RepID=A0A4P9WFZ9_9FUNG|nr:hypothetical protein BDK51DRAFT_46778 [Blyttiomyces helicus]|eukprot:RKO89950.1 hypothetical protein BDK51DRAFT_46778 [Blyttiomyces helicus]